jgi:hypothetical protein
MSNVGERLTPVVGSQVAAIHNGDPDAFLAVLSPDATLTHDGRPPGCLVDQWGISHPRGDLRCWLGV